MSDFNQFPDTFNVVKGEEHVLDFFEQNNIYKKQQLKNADGEIFNFFDGPPFCSGNNLHNGHALVSVCKSTILNYKSMLGYDVKNKIGFDVHGIPSESLANKLLGLNTRQDVINYGVDKYNAFCKKTVLDISNSWEPLFKRIGRFVDYNDQYKTMDKNYMESCWWVFKQLWDKGLVYRGFKVMPFSTSLNTPLSNQEAGQNYKDVVDITVFVKFKIIDEVDMYFIAWTTTPWTLPSNLALGVNPKLDYSIIKDHASGHLYIIGKDAIGNLYPPSKKKNYIRPYDIIDDTIKGITLINKKYEPLYNCFSENREFKIIGADFVTAETGTGIVHLAPAFGIDDYNVCIEHNIVTPKTLGDVCPIDEEGKFTDKVPEYEGMYFGDANKEVIKDLKQQGKSIKIMDYKHSYPFCWRTNTPLLYIAVTSFFNCCFL